ncbi:hypothetical protein ACET3Z_021287 [Daucus carota]
MTVNLEYIPDNNNMLFIALGVQQNASLQNPEITSDPEKTISKDILDAGEEIVHENVPHAETELGNDPKIQDADYMKSIETIVAYAYLESYYEDDDVEVKKVDKREREIQRKVRENENFYLNKVLNSNRKIWKDPSRLKVELQMSDCPSAEKIRKDRRRR